MPGSETILLELDNLSSATNHNGGALHFGVDGKLYIASGNNANNANSQTLTNLLGKMLRLNSDGTIPTDNPFYNQPTGKNRAIWAYGLRNPFTFGIQPGTGLMFVDDVGENTWEEINVGVAGRQLRLGDLRGPVRPVRSTRCYRVHGSRSTGTSTSAGSAPSRAATSTTPTSPSSRRATSASTSSRTSARAGSSTSTRRPRARRPA